MYLFTPRHKEQEVHRLIVQILNHHCDRVVNAQDGPRIEGRVSLTMAVQVIPCQGRKPMFDAAFPAVTKEFSCNGLALVVSPPLEAKQVIIGLKWNDRMMYLRGDCRHQEPLGAGFWAAGIQTTEIVDPDDYPQLQSFVV